MTFHRDRFDQAPRLAAGAWPTMREVMRASGTLQLPIVYEGLAPFRSRWQRPEELAEEGRRVREERRLRRLATPPPALEPPDTPDEPEDAPTEEALAPVDDRDERIQAGCRLLEKAVAARNHVQHRIGQLLELGLSSRPGTAEPIKQALREDRALLAQLDERIAEIGRLMAISASGPFPAEW